MKIYAYLALLALLGAAFGATYHFGQLSERDKVVKATNEFREREASLLAQIEDAKKKTKVEYRDRIKVVKEAVGSCLDERIPSPLLDSLRNDLFAG